MIMECTVRRNTDRDKKRLVWYQMVSRCTDPTAWAYERYGGRGIQVCARWLDFENYLEDVVALGPRPEGYSIDRIDNDGDYEPGNIRWASRQEQARNRAAWTMRPGVTSPYKGVGWHKEHKTWRARIQTGVKRQHLGFFATDEEAAHAYDRAALQYFGPGAVLNFPEEVMSDG